jgi:glycosidase
VSRSHGYDVIDHLRIDPRLGDDQDFDHLVSACHARGIRLLLDGVFNHVSVEHDWVRAALVNPEGSPAARYLRSDTQDRDHFSRFEGHEGLVELDHSCDEVAEYVVRVMNHWLDRGGDGWRLDAAYRVPNQFWAKVIAEVRTRHPESVFVAEVLHGDYSAIAHEADFDSITQYELWKAIWSSLKDRNPYELLWALQRHDTAMDHLIPWTFVGNHDVTRISTQVGSASAALATAILMVLPGTPAIYYGDELGLTGLKQECWGGDDAIRPVLPELPGDWNDQQEATVSLTQQMIHIRRTHPWIASGRIQILDHEYQRLTWRVGSSHGDWIQVDLDVTEEEARLRITDDTGLLLAL